MKNMLYLEYYIKMDSFRIYIEKNNFVIGRNKNYCDFIIEDEVIDDVHIEIITKGKKFFIKDLNSRNGVFINGNSKRVKPSTDIKINEKDRITIGDLDLTVRLPIKNLEIG